MKIRVLLLGSLLLALGCGEETISIDGMVIGGLPNDVLSCDHGAFRVTIRDASGDALASPLLGKRERLENGERSRVREFQVRVPRSKAYEFQVGDCKPEIRSLESIQRTNAANRDTPTSLPSVLLSPTRP